MLSCKRLLFRLGTFSAPLGCESSRSGRRLWIKGTRFRVSEVPACPNCSATVGIASLPSVPTTPSLRSGFGFQDLLAYCIGSRICGLGFGFRDAGCRFCAVGPPFWVWTVLWGGDAAGSGTRLTTLLVVLLMYSLDYNCWIRGLEGALPRL